MITATKVIKIISLSSICLLATARLALADGVPTPSTTPLPHPSTVATNCTMQRTIVNTTASSTYKYHDQTCSRAAKTTGTCIKRTIESTNPHSTYSLKDSVGNCDGITSSTDTNTTQTQNCAIDRTIQSNTATTSYYLHDQICRGTMTNAKTASIPMVTPLPTAPPAPTPTIEEAPVISPTPQVLGSVKQLPSTGPGETLVLSLGGIVMALISKKLVLSH